MSSVPSSSPSHAMERLTVIGSSPSHVKQTSGPVDGATGSGSLHVECEAGRCQTSEAVVSASEPGDAGAGGFSSDLCSYH